MFHIFNKKNKKSLASVILTNLRILVCSPVTLFISSALVQAGVCGKTWLSIAAVRVLFPAHKQLIVNDLCEKNLILLL